MLQPLFGFRGLLPITGGQDRLLTCLLRLDQELYGLFTGSEQGEVQPLPVRLGILVYRFTSRRLF